MGISPEYTRLLRFGVVGACALAVYSAALWIAVHGFGRGQVSGALVGFVLATLVSYLGNSRFVFRSRPTRANAARFGIVTLAGLGLNLGSAFLLERLGSPVLLTALIIFLTVPVFNYLCHRAWTFDGPGSGMVG